MMVRRPVLALCLLVAPAAAWGQTGTLPPLGGLGGPAQFPSGGGGAPATGGPAGGGAAGGDQAGRSGPGFGGGQAAVPGQGFGGRQNYADELTDFHVAPQSTLQANVGSETPLSVPGGHLITTAEVRQAQGMQALVIDVLAAPPHPTLPGALLWPGAGNPGSFDDQVQQQLWAALSQATQRNPAVPLIFLCAGSRCWESYNAALRAANMGFKTVLWYRGGLAAWQAAGLQLVPPGQGGAAPQPQPQAAPAIGFGRP